MIAEKLIAQDIRVMLPSPENVPFCISLDALDEYGCPNCGCGQGIIANVASGTVVWICRSCNKATHALCTDTTHSAIALPDGSFPERTKHPLEGMIKDRS